MLDYECIIAYYDATLRRGRCWLRLYEQARQTVVLLTDLPGNDGPSVSEAILPLITLVIQRYHLDPERTTFLD